MKRFLVTGGAGFIGGSLACALAKTYEVTILDIQIRNREVFERGGIRCQEGDICNFWKLLEVFSGIDGVFHCGAYARIGSSIKNPKKAQEVNIWGTLNVLAAAKLAGVKRVVYSASSSVYGKQPVPWHEDLPAQPLNPYATTKYAGEVLCRMSALFCDLPTVLLRYANVYGSEGAVFGHISPPSVIEMFLRNKMVKLPLKLVGDGNQRRDFVHVSDVVAANLKAMFSSTVGKGEAINIGSGKSYRIKELAELVGGPTVSVPYRYEEPEETLLDIAKAKQLLAWKPTIDVKEWIRAINK